MFVGKTKQLLSVALALGCYAGLAQAQDVSATKTAPATGAINKITADLQLRHYAKVSGQGNEENLTPSGQVRTNITGTLFDEKLSSTLILAGNKNTSTTQITQRRPEVWSEFDLVSGDNFAIKPYLDLFLPAAGSGTDGNLGFYPSVTTGKLNVIGGQLEVIGEAYFHAALGSRAEDARVRADETVRSRFGLTASESSSEEGILAGGKDDPSYNTQYVAGVAYEPTAVKGLTVSTQLLFTREFEPVYTLNDDGTRDVAFDATPYVENLVKAAYKVNDKVKLVNELWLKHDGFYASRVDADATNPRLTNLAYLAYTLF